MTFTISIIFYVILAIVGLICLYNAYDMKTNGDLKIGWFVGQSVKKEKCRDIKGFINATLTPIIIFGGSVVAASAALILLAGFNGPKYIQLIILVFLIILYVWFTNVLNKASEKYLK